MDTREPLLPNIEEAKAAMLCDELIEAISSVFKILGDPTRMRLVWALDRQELCVGDLAEVLDMTSSAISHQLSILKNEHLVKTRRDGKNIYYSLDDSHVTDMIELAKIHIEHQ